ncbi:MAG: SixA phosphatase family protein [Flavisolibacter sp.]|jgi:phosphohistidine phosphatase
MKTLLLVRHAKSSWDTPGLSDYDRPLNERGKKDAPEMAKRLKERGVRLDLVVTSPAKRAKRTARYFAETFGIDKDDILLVEDLYGAMPDAFVRTISSIEEKYNSIAVFSHNPGISEFAGSLSNVRVDDMPTCAVFAVQASVDSWAEFAEAEKKFLFFDYPKNPLPTL